VVIWYIFHILVFCTKNNLATLGGSSCWGHNRSKSTALRRPIQRSRHAPRVAGALSTRARSFCRYGETYWRGTTALLIEALPYLFIYKILCGNIFTYLLK
jgi:hypothetical protein